MNRASRAIIGGWGLILLVCAWWLAFETPLNADLTLFMPRSSSPAERLLLEQLREGPAARLILIAVEGGQETERANLAKLLAERLRASGRFLRVENGDYQLSSEEQALLFRYRYLLDPGLSPGNFSPEGLRNALEQRLRELQSPLSGIYKRLLPADPTGSLHGLLELVAGSAGVERRHGIWFSPDGARALLLADAGGGSFELDAQQENIRFIRESFYHLTGSEKAQMVLSGPAVFAVGSREVIIAQSSLLGAGAVVLLALIFYAGYRSLPLFLLGALPMVTAILAGATGVSLAHGGIHGITLGFGFTLLGITMDYPVHLFSHLDSAGSAERAMSDIWPTLRLGAVTTALGFLAMTATEFSGLVQLGLFAALGLLAAAATTRWVLPPLLQRIGSKATPRPLPALVARKMLRTGRIRRITALLAAVIALLLLIAAGDARWEDDLAALSPVPDRLIALDRELRRDMKAPGVSHLISLEAANAEQVLQGLESIQPDLETLVELGVLEGFDSPAKFLPSRRTQEARQGMLPEPETLPSNLNQALEGLPFRLEVFEPFLEGVEQSRELPPLTPVELAGSLLGLRVSSQLFATDKGWLAIVPLSGVRSGVELAQWFADHPLPRGVYVDVKQQTNRMISRFRMEALEWLALGAGAILVVLALALRSLPLALRVILPVAGALAVDSALLVGIGERLSLFHLVSLLMVLGISLDYSLFFNRREGDDRERHKTLHALTLCAASTVSLFGLLALSSVPVLGAIGRTVALGVVVAYLFTMAVGRTREEVAA